MYWMPQQKSGLADLCNKKVPISGKPEIGRAGRDKGARAA